MPNPADEFFGGGHKSASFNGTAPITVSGTITRVGEPVQQRDLVSGTPKTWDNGDPMMQLPVDVQTTLRESDEDDGVRTLYIKGQMRAAIRDALRAAGSDGLRVGGTLSVTYTGDAKPSAPGLNGAKQYAATYSQPAAGAAFLGIEQPPATPEPVAAAPVAPAPAGQDPVSLAKQLISAGLDDETISTSTGLPAVAIAALRNTVAA